jgi:hypothetical protein
MINLAERICFRAGAVASDCPFAALRIAPMHFQGLENQGCESSMDWKNAGAQVPIIGSLWGVAGRSPSHCHLV